jgi:hypothetical protein
MKLKRNRDIGLYSPGWQLKSKLAGQVHMAGWLPSRIYFRGLGPHRPEEMEDQCCRHHTRRYGVHDRDSTPGDCWEARSFQLVGCQRDPSSTRGERLRSIMWHCTRGRYFV